MEVGATTCLIPFAQSIGQSSIIHSMVFIEFPAFTKAIIKLPDDDYSIFQRELVASPESGDLIRGTGGFRKARMAFPSVGIGKSGGARVIYLYLADLQIIILVALYAK